MKFTWHRLRRSLFYPCLATVLVAASGCTTVPTKEFASYKETFNQARKAGEDVLLDYGVAVAKRDEIKAKKAAAEAKPKLRGASFDPSAISTQTAAVDHIAVRMKAWDVVSRYNDLLTALAEGKAAAELAGAVDGLSSSLGTFPVAEVALSWTEVSGYLAVIKPLALEAVREQSRREFVAAVGKGGPLITEKLIKLLKDDTANFYQLREGLNDRQYEPLVDEASHARDRFEAIAAKLQPTPPVVEALDIVNQQVSRLPSDEAGIAAVAPIALKTPPAGAPAPTTETVVQLQSLEADITALVGEALAKDAELDAYREVLTHYVGMLNQVDQSMRVLQIAAEQAQPGIPRGADLERAVILLREAYMKYKDIGKE